MALSVSNPQSKDPTSTIVKQSSGIPGLDNTILFSPRQFPTFSSGVHVDRPAKRRRLASHPSHGLVFNFGLVSNASRNESSPPSTYEPGRDIALERPKIAQAAQIEISELSEEAKAIMGYTTEKFFTLRRVASQSRFRGREQEKIQKQREQRTQRGNAAQLATEMRAKQLVAALAESGTDDDRESTSPGVMTVSGPVVHLPTARGTSLPLTSILKRIGRDPTPIKRVHFLTFDKLVSHTVAVVHASFLNPLLTPATLINALEHFQSLVRLAESSVAFRERRQRLPTNFDLDVNSTPVLFTPSRKLKIAEAARIDVSELSEETKRIMGYAVERPVDDNTVAPILGAQTDEVKTQASPVSRFSAGKTISAARAKLANEAGAKYNIKSTSESLTEDVSSIDMNPLSGSDQDPICHSSAQAEEEDIEAADDGERNARVEAMMVFNPVIGAITVLRSSRNPVSVLKTHVSRSAHSKRVHFLALETLVQHTSIRLARYNDKKIFGPVLSMSFVLLHASFSSSPPNSAKLLSALEDFKGMLTLLLEKLRELLRTAQASEGAAKKAALFREQVVLAKNDMGFLERRYICSIHSIVLGIV
ncbi:hypothetical protein D6C92_10410 [Aureobasidium pullulans]|nr:hypothetical protein D6C92_10410 [Aureobasidium pullulans]